MNDYARTLERLRDIHLPSEPGFWPPAPGWWLLALLVLVAILILWFGNRTRLRRRQRRQVWSQLNSLEQLWREHGDNRRYVAELSALLRRVAMITYERREVASMNGDSWLRFLDHACSHKEFVAGVGARLADGPYRPEPLDTDQARQLQELVRVWVRENL